MKEASLRTRARQLAEAGVTQNPSMLLLKRRAGRYTAPVVAVTQNPGNVTQNPGNVTQNPGSVTQNPCADVMNLGILAGMATRKPQPVVDSTQLPIWPNELRGLPNALARSALFCVANQRGAREMFKKRPIAALAGIEITYSGEELRQDDEDVFLQILHIARMRDLATTCTFTAYAMLTELGWDKSSKGYKRLVECIDRLKFSSISVTVESPTVRQNYTGALIRSFRWKEASGDSPLREWEVLLEKEITALFSPEGYTRLDWSTRLQLSPMAKWLHSFYHTHRAPFAFKTENLRELMGSKITELRAFRFALRRALKDLVEIGFLTSAKVDSRTDLVIIERAGRQEQLQ